MAPKKQSDTRESRSKRSSRRNSARPAKRAKKPGAAANRAATRTAPLIIGVGASAGGLEAFTQLLQHLPTDTGMAFVLVQHLDPVRESALTDLLSRATSLPVRDVTNDLPVEPDHIYVIPPNTSLSIANAVLKLQPRQATAGARSIDFFFESLAQDQRERAIGVVLSGTATDGTLGLEAIKAEGGITFAQDDSARYDSMPRSAVAAGCVDFVLKPQDIAKELARIAKHPFVAGSPADPLTSPEDDRASATAHADDETPLPSGGHGTPRTGAKQARAEGEAARSKAGDNGFKKILILLRNHCGVDFSLYKSTTIQRRITRRMVLHRQYTLEDYARFIRGNTKELDALYSDVLISVTSFFRNPEAFDILRREVFPKLLQRRGDEPLRVWVLGCSTGQEAYSIAMTFVEAAEKAPRMHKLQVFATDLNEALLDKARHGLYAKNLAQDISPGRLRQFFAEEEGGYRVNKPLREMVVFARQNFISDPPFSRMDLVSCRNLMIYLEPSLQKKLLPTFHYALRPEGFLFLGASESISGFTDLFEPLDRKHKIYSRKAAPIPAFQLPVKRERDERASPARLRKAGTPPLPIAGQGEPEAFRAELNSQREADRLMVNKYAPPGVLVNADLQILQFRGPTGAYLEPPTGKASFDVLKMARGGLMLPLRAAINKAKKENQTVRTENVRFEQNGETRAVNMEVIPLKNLRDRCFLILFEDAERGARALPGAPSREWPGGAARTSRPTSKKEESRHIANLERELSETRDYLQSVQEQHEAANEELQASNEEIQSGNEELQSINEELETSKEELESANEELSTVNEEMANRNIELNLLNNDLVNLQASTHLAIVLLGRDLSIRRFSAQAEKQFNLLATDVGRSISGMRHNLDLTDLETFVGEVIASVREREREVRDKEGRWYSMRVRPYLTVDNKVDGAVLVLVDIDGLKRTERLIAEAREHAEAIIDTVPHPLVILHRDLRVRSANDAFYRDFKLAPAETVGRSIFEIDHGSWSNPKLRKLLEDIIPRNSFFKDFEVTREFERIGRRILLLDARLLLQPDGKAKFVLLGIRDISERKLAEEALRESQSRLQFALDSAQVGDWDLDLTTDTARRSLRHDQAFGYTEPVQEWGFEKFIQHVHPEDRAGIERQFRDAVTQQRDWRFECRVVWPDGSVHWIAAHGSIYRTLEGQPNRMLGIVFDITERKRAEERERLLANELAHRGKNLLAVVQSITSRSLSGTRSLTEAREVLLHRIQALARSQSVLVTEGFEGAPVAEIVRLEFAAFSERVKADGPNVMLNPRAGQTFALLVHELATNATKYGALSRPGGRVAIRWRVEGVGEEARFRFEWQERDGPAVVPPTRQGFGRILLKQAAQDFGAQPKISFAPEGLSYEIDASLSAIVGGLAAIE